MLVSAYITSLPIRCQEKGSPRVLCRRMGSGQRTVQRVQECRSAESTGVQKSTAQCPVRYTGGLVRLSAVLVALGNHLTRTSDLASETCPPHP